MDIDPHHLPAEVNLLQQIVLQLLQAVEDKDHLVARLQHQLAQLLRYRYGQKRERIDENQLFLFAAQLIAASLQTDPTPCGEEPAANSSLNSDRKDKGEKPEHRGHGRKPLPKSLERRRVVFELEESQRQCQHCQTPMQKIGEDVSERLEFIPASLQVIEEVRPKYACAKGCCVAAAPKPAALIEKGLPGPGLLAHVAVSKYGDHLPLNRMESIFQRHGVELSRKTMCDWMAACAELVSPVWERMKGIVLTSKAVQTDDTPVPVLDRQLTRTRTGRIWTYVGDRNGPYIVYDYTGNRSREGPEEFLRGYSGFLQADAYAAYDAMFTNPKRSLTEIACWAHARRYFFEAADFRSVPSHGNARLHPTAVRSGAGSSQCHYRTTAGITPSEIASDSGGYKELLADRKTEGAAQEPDGCSDRLYVIQLGSAAALHGRRRSRNRQQSSRAQPSLYRCRPTQLAFLRKRQRWANRSRPEYSDRQLQAAKHRAFCLSSRSVHAHQQPSAPPAR
jgi:transposase